MTKETFFQLEHILNTYCSDSVHDLSHVYRVLMLVLDIAQYETVDMDVLITATLFHDIARDEERVNSAVCHAERGAELVGGILNKFFYTSFQIARIQECIRTHRFRGINHPKSMEAKILFDADKLDAVGCIGVARALMYAGIIGEPLYSTEKNFSEIDYNTPSFIWEYNYKLSQLGQQFYTKRAVELWKTRNDYAHKFYEGLLLEIKNTLWNKDMFEKFLQKNNEK